jgi:hypothetical protein
MQCQSFSRPRRARRGNGMSASGTGPLIMIEIEYATGGGFSEKVQAALAGQFPSNAL